MACQPVAAPVEAVDGDAGRVQGLEPRRWLTGRDVSRDSPLRRARVVTRYFRGLQSVSSLLPESISRPSSPDPQRRAGPWNRSSEIPTTSWPALKGPCMCQYDPRCDIEEHSSIEACPQMKTLGQATPSAVSTGSKAPRPAREDTARRIKQRAAWREIWTTQGISLLGFFLRS